MSAAKSKKARRRLRAAASTLAILMAGIAAVLAVAVWALLFRPATRVEVGRPVQIEIEQGQTTTRIARELAAAGVVSNANMFRLQARLADAGASMKPGVYDFRTGTSYGDALERLVEGPPVDYVTVTIPEGFIVDQIAARLENLVGIPADETLALAKGGADQFAEDHPYLADAYGASLEGYLFPKTYRIPKGSGAKAALEMMLDQFDREVAAVDVEAAEALGLDFNEFVVVASMIEREAQLDEERPLVSSVIQNRLRKGMMLEIDATVEYVLPGNKFRRRWGELGVDSPYNTYMKKGLPPGPIASPGLASLKAAAAPADTDYLYYVLTGKDGSHTFATNKADFLKAKAKSKEVFGR